MCTYDYQKPYVTMLMVAFFMRAPNQEQLKCPPAGESINKPHNCNNEQKKPDRKESM